MPGAVLGACPGSSRTKPGALCQVLVFPLFRGLFPPVLSPQAIDYKCLIAIFGPVPTFPQSIYPLARNSPPRALDTYAGGNAIVKGYPLKKVGTVGTNTYNLLKYKGKVCSHFCSHFVPTVGTRRSSYGLGENRQEGGEVSSRRQSRGSVVSVKFCKKIGSPGPRSGGCHPAGAARRRLALR